jgi:uncharacterized protein (DUF2461 family)
LSAAVEQAVGERLEQITDALERAGVELACHDRLKTAPCGFAKDHPRVELLKFKGPS